MVATVFTLHMKAQESKFPLAPVFPFNNVILISPKIISEKVKALQIYRRNNSHHHKFIPRFWQFQHQESLESEQFWRKPYYCAVKISQSEKT